MNIRSGYFSHFLQFSILNGLKRSANQKTEARILHHCLWRKFGIVEYRGEFNSHVFATINHCYTKTILNQVQPSPCFEIS